MPPNTAPPTPAPVEPTVPSSDLGIHIDDVNKSLWQFVRQRKLGELLLFVPLVTVWEAIIIFFMVKYLSAVQVSNNDNSGIKGFVYLLLLPVSIFGSWIYKLRIQFENTFLQEFAAANSYSFDKNGSVDEAYGSIFRLKGQQQVSDVISGTYDNNGLRLFLYQLNIRSGGSQQAYRNTVMELDLHGQLPNLLMVNKNSKSNHLGLSGIFGVKNVISLEGDFNKYFTLYAPQENNIEALEVFSPDTMALMEDHSKHYTVEFAANKVYIYANYFISTTEELTQMFSLAKKLIEKIGPLAGRLANDSAIITPPVNITMNRKSPFLSNKFQQVLIVSIVFIAGLSVALLAANAHQVLPNENNGSGGTPSGPVYVSQNPYDVPPFCGIKPSTSFPAATQQYVTALNTVNGAESIISNELSDEGKLVNPTNMQAQISADTKFLTSLEAISYPSNIKSDAANQQAAIKNLDNLLAEEEKEYPSILVDTQNSLSSAHQARDSASNRMRTDFGLPASTCTFIIP